tara:strand:+ start:859 stop:1380 length:522 start_codon:yes stop_codon:yes gene_type:complete
MDWYYASNGQQQGPVSQDQLKELAKGGQVQGSDLVWNEGMTDWVPLSTLPEFAIAAEKSETVSAVAADPDPDPPVLTQATPPAQVSVANTGEKVPTYLWQSIVCLVLCCLPTGIAAVVYSTKVEPAQMRGDLAAAREASSKAKMWCWISFGVGIVMNLIGIAVGVVGALSEGS